MMIKRRFFLLLIMPLVILLFLTGMVPFIYVVFLSLYDYSLGAGTFRYIGALNYLNALKDDVFINSILKTLLYATVSLVIEIFLGFLIALFLYEELPLKGFLKTILVLPIAIPPLVAGLIWRIMTNPDVGILPYTLNTFFHMEYNIGIYASQAFITTVVVDVWRWTPLVAFILLAGLASIPATNIEAAEIEGATYYQKVRYIYIPLIKQEFIIAILLRLMDALRVFDEVWMLTGGGPGIATYYANIYIYKTALAVWQLGYAAALSVIVLYIIIGLSSFIYNVLMRARR